MSTHTRCRSKALVRWPTSRTCKCGGEYRLDAWMKSRVRSTVRDRDNVTTTPTGRIGAMSTTLLETVTGWMKFQARKHDLGEPEEYAETLVNNMSQYEFLVTISEALETMSPPVDVVIPVPPPVVMVFIPVRSASVPI